MKIVNAKTYENVSAFADIALKNRLYVSGWSLSGILKDARNNPANCKIMLAYVDDKPVGVCVTYCNTIAVFVKRDKRKHGVGTKLVNTAKKLIKGKPMSSYGVVGSEKFWHKCGVEMSY